MGFFEAAGGGLTDIAGMFIQNEMNKSAASTAFDRNVKMYKHRHQWEVADLRKAGLNPILSAQGQPPSASTPVAQTPDVTGVGSNFISNLQKSNSAKMQETEAEILKNQNEKAKADVATAKAQARSANVDANKKENEWLNMYGTDLGKKWMPWFEKFGIGPSTLAAGASIGVSNDTSAKKVAEPVGETWKQNPNSETVDWSKYNDWHQSNSAAREEKKVQKLNTMSEKEVRQSAVDVLKKLGYN